MRDFYEVLGVERTADQDTIRRAYRRLARKYHPDLNPAAADTFKEIAGAYDVLGDPKRRELYDEFGDVCLQPSFDPVVARHAGLGRGGGGGGGDDHSPGAFAEFFAGLNSGGGGGDSGGGSAAGTRAYQGSARGPEETSTDHTNGAEIPGFGGFGAASGTRSYQGSAGERYDPNDGFQGSASGTRAYQGSAGERYDPNESYQGSASGTTPYRGSATEAGRTGFKRHTSKEEAYFPGKSYGDGRASRASRSSQRQADPHRQRMRANRNTAPPPPSQQPTPVPPRGGSPYANRMGRTAPGGAAYSTSTAAPVPGSNISVTLEISLMEALRGTAREMFVERTLHTGRREQEGLRVSIKAGVEDGEELRLRGKGNQGRSGGPPGDLLLTIQVNTPRHFRREGHDLFLEVPITLQEALLGSKIEVPTPDGVVRVAVPSGSTNGRRLRLRRRGVSVGNGQRGDLYLILRPTPPTTDSPEVRRLIAELERFYPAGGVRAGLEL